MSGRLYWFGNAAKAKIIQEILRDISKREIGNRVLIFDYGCGTGGDWPRVLNDYPSIHLVGYDPNRSAIEVAKTRLQGFSAELLTGDQLQSMPFLADYIVSFSVFEHVYDRLAYLQTAKTHLAEDGIFYLNYDDGHFRNMLDLNAPRAWPVTLRVWLHNLLSSSLAKLGWKAQFQRRVPR